MRTTAQHARYPNLARLLLTVQRRSVDTNAATPSLTLLKNEVALLQRLIEASGATDNDLVRSLIDSINSRWECLEAEQWVSSVTRRLFDAAQSELDAEFPPPKSGLHKIFDFLQENPGKSLAGAALVAVGAPVVAPALLVGGLNIVGFSSVGPVAGTLAATIQSVFYGGAVASGSLFAAAQSAAMGGVVVASAAEVALGAAAVGTGLGMVATAGDQEEPDRDDYRVVCLIDGDSHPFHEVFLINGEFGGRGAAIRLCGDIMQTLRDHPNVQLHQTVPQQVEVRILCDMNSLARTLSSGGICTTRVFRQFVVGFNKALPTFNIVDESSVSTRVKATERLVYLCRNRRIKSVIFGGVYDTRHIATLQSLQEEGILRKVTILKGPHGMIPTVEEFHQLANVQIIEMPVLFTKSPSTATLEEAAATVTRIESRERAPAGSVFPATTNQSTPSVEQPEIVLAATSIQVIGNLPHGAPPDNSARSSRELTPAGRTPSDDTQNEPTPARATARINPHKPFTKQTPPLCNTHYHLPNGCRWGARCRFSHDYVLNPRQLAAYRNELRRLPCNNAIANGTCPNGDSCLMGHVCPHGLECRFLLRQSCRFPTHGGSPE